MKSCIDCGIPIDKRSTRCKSCAQRCRWAQGDFCHRKRSPNHCIDCRIPISPRATRCHSCTNHVRTYSEESKAKISKSVKQYCQEHPDCHIHTKETKEKIRQALTGRPKSEEHKRKLSQSKKELWQTHPHPWLCRHHTEETKKKISEAIKKYQKENGSPWLGRHHSEESRAIISKARMGKSMSVQARESMRQGHARRHAENPEWCEEKAIRASKRTKDLWASGVFRNVNFHPSVEYKGHRMRSGWEKRLAQAFDKLGWNWEYETITFTYVLGRESHSYTPDFYVSDINTYFDPHGDCPIWQDALKKFEAIRNQAKIALVVINEQLLLAYERLADTIAVE